MRLADRGHGNVETVARYVYLRAKSVAGPGPALEPPQRPIGSPAVAARARPSPRGENGAGKTTLVKLLCGLYEPTAGRILVDGVELGRVRADEWRQRLAGAFQDFFRFELVARRSVGLGDVKRLDDERAVLGAAERAGADDVVARLPFGLDTQLGPTWPQGVEVSFGQWQKIALARGFMREAPLPLVLDEPTAALRRQRFLEQLNAAYATLRADPRTWATIEDERRAWDATLPDGLAVAVEDRLRILLRL